MHTVKRLRSLACVTFFQVPIRVTITASFCLSSSFSSLCSLSCIVSIGIHPVSFASLCSPIGISSAFSTLVSCSFRVRLAVVSQVAETHEIRQVCCDVVAPHSFVEIDIHPVLHLAASPRTYAPSRGMCWSGCSCPSVHCECKASQRGYTFEAGLAEPRWFRAQSLCTRMLFVHSPSSFSDTFLAVKLTCWRGNFRSNCMPRFAASHDMIIMIIIFIIIQCTIARVCSVHSCARRLRNMRVGTFTSHDAVVAATHNASLVGNPS